MVEKKPGPSGGERRFLAVCGAALILTGALAFWFSVPFGPAVSDPGAARPLIQSARVDLNTAGLEALCTLPGIGEEKAQRILDYRAEYGPFRRVEDAARVSGISEAMIERWQGLAYAG